MKKETQNLKSAFDENEWGLGYYSYKIEDLLDDVEEHNYIAIDVIDRVIGELKYNADILQWWNG